MNGFFMNDGFFHKVICTLCNVLGYTYTPIRQTHSQIMKTNEETIAKVCRYTIRQCLSFRFCAIVSCCCCCCSLHSFFSHLEFAAAENILYPTVAHTKTKYVCTLYVRCLT